jgi:2-keto-3-deoxy-L-rhamnonate aldolase RhmA
MRTNLMKAKLKAGKPAIGCSVMLPSPQIIEMLGQSASHWVEYSFVIQAQQKVI